MRVLTLVVLMLAGTIVSAHAQPFQAMDATIDEVKAALASKRTSCVALVEQYIARIEAYDKRGPTLNAVQTINPSAISQAKLLDAMPESRGSLHCVRS